MKAMIFAAGMGTRLKPFTQDHPKALVPVAGVPMLQRVIKNIADAGIMEIVVNVHHFASQIVDFLNRNNNFGLDIQISDESDCLLDTGGGLRKAKNLLLRENFDSTEPILLHNADIFTDTNLRDMIDYHVRSKADVTLLCSHRISSRTLYFEKTDNHLLGWENLTTKECKPSGFIPGDTADSSPFGGIHIINPVIFPLLDEYINDEDKSFSIIPFYLANLSRIKIKRHLLSENNNWFDVGSAEKLALAEKFLYNNHFE